MIRTIDLFCGAGGSSCGAQAAGATILAAFDKWDLALATYRDNFPKARIYPGPIEEISGKRVAQEIGRVDLILASPECNGHTHARGRRPLSEDTRMTAYEVLRFAKVLRPRWIVIENVVNIKTWGRYAEFLQRLHSLGYWIREQILDAARFGVPQSRRRLFLSCDLERMPSETIPGNAGLLPARSCVGLNGPYPFSPLWGSARARSTLQRARRAIRKLGVGKPFLIVYYSSDGAGGWQRLDVPLRTVTTLDRFALVRWSAHGPEMRMLQPEELRAAMGFPPSFRLRHGTRRDRIRLLGNAVCPPVMAAVVRSLTGA
jgi:DNA (cytosine-5)-methyltransferase 1